MPTKVSGRPGEYWILINDKSHYFRRQCVCQIFLEISVQRRRLFWRRRLRWINLSVYYIWANCWGWTWKTDNGESNITQCNHDMIFSERSYAYVAARVSILPPNGTQCSTRRDNIRNADIDLYITRSSTLSRYLRSYEKTSLDGWDTSWAENRLRWSMK